MEYITKSLTVTSRFEVKPPASPCLGSVILSKLIRVMTDECGAYVSSFNHLSVSELASCSSSHLIFVIIHQSKYD